MACCSPSKNHSTLAVTGQALPTHHGTTPQGPGPPSQGHHTPLQPTKGVLGPSAHARSPSVCTRRTSAAARALYDRAPLRTSCEGVHGCRWCGGSDGGGPQGGWRREHAGGSGGMPPHARSPPRCAARTARASGRGQGRGGADDGGCPSAAARGGSGSHRVDEEDEPAPKRKKVMSRAARAWRRWVCGGRERTREWRCAFASLLAVCACAREAVIRSVRYSLFSVSMLLSSYES